jgi:periplasmic protein TonB
MKREKRFGKLTGISLILLIPATATMIFLLASCGKTINSGTGEGEATASRQSPLSVNPDSAYVQVDEMPVFPGGDNALLKFIAENTKYPEEAKKNNVTGKVILRFIVGTDCMVSHVTLLQGVDPLLDAEALRVVSSLPKFETPAKVNGRAVPVYYMVPITFALR